MDDNETLKHSKWECQYRLHPEVPQEYFVPNAETVSRGCILLAGQIRFAILRYAGGGGGGTYRCHASQI
jgi:hypothetical protein